MIVFIMNFQWYTWPKKQAEFLTACGHNVVIVDNNSTYPPLLEWYKKCPYRVIHTGDFPLKVQNRFIWEMGLHDLVADNYYAVTDADMELHWLPKDFTDYLIHDIARNPEILKSGLSIRTDDLPDNPYANFYKASERDNFPTPDKYGFHNVQVDTTFAVYSKERCNNIDKMWRKPGSTVTNWLDDEYFYRAHRSPFAVRHLPWYLTPETLTEEQLHHIKSAKYGSLYEFKKMYGL
ncbi:MAG TPA: hypothetical protein ACFYEK_01095 [Candidatus Wunengus sp. YC60]|uniref:hypothetical protein n=1 Tax=Candidatus Wunengus sp. YC60 TaxID=3367697 RepID=UPI0040260EB1